MNPFSIALDIVFIAIFVICAILGKRKGFVRMVLSFAAFVASWIAAEKFSPAVSEWLNDNFIRENAVALLTEKISNVLESGTDEIIGAIPEYLSKIAELAGVSLESMHSSASEPSVIAQNIFSACESTVVLPLLELLTFIAIFIVANMILAFVVRLADKIFNLPVLKTFNSAFGGLLGAIKGLCYVFILGLTLNAAEYVITDGRFAEIINGSYIQNLISFLIEKF